MEKIEVFTKGRANPITRTSEEIYVEIVSDVTTFMGFQKDHPRRLWELGISTSELQHYVVHQIDVENSKNIPIVVTKASQLTLYPHGCVYSTMDDYIPSGMERPTTYRLDVEYNINPGKTYQYTNAGMKQEWSFLYHKDGSLSLQVTNKEPCGAITSNYPIHCHIDNREHVRI